MKKIISIVLLFVVFMANAQEKSIFDIARTGSLEEMKMAFKNNPESINALNENQSSTLILACYRGNIEVAKFLIAHVKDINYNSGMGTALMGATYKNQFDLVKLLLENKANPNLVDASGATALILATQNANVELIKLLLKYNADKTIKTKEGKTAFEFAVFSGIETTINALK